MVRVVGVFRCTSAARLTSGIVRSVKSAVKPPRRHTNEGIVSHVRDGDTIELGPIAVRLQGIAAPEVNEPGGDIATDAIRDLVLGKDLRCDRTGDRSYDRVIGVCFLEDGRDVGEIMVFQGHARDCRRFSRGRYADAEKHARTMGHNLSQIYALPEYCE